MAGVVLLGLAVAHPAAVLAGTPAQDDLASIRQCVRQNLPQNSVSQHIRLISEDPAGGRQTLEATLYGVKSKRGFVDLMLSVDAPADLRGARYLLIAKSGQDDMYVYLPALNRVRRVVGGMRGQPLWGTDFSYEDIKHLQHVLLGSQVEYLGQGESNGRVQHQLLVRPEASEDSVYSHIEMDVDATSCLLSQVRFFDEAGLFKRMSCDVEAYRQVEGRWVYGEVTMRNLRNGTKSILELADVQYDRELSRRLFHPKSFYLVH